MATNTTPGSAVIYEFPIEVRRAAIQREQARLAATAKAAPLAAVSSGWYHEAAIEEASGESNPRRDH